MAKLLVTGATGQLGRGIVEHVLKLKPASQIATLASDPAAHRSSERGFQFC
jgi:uncharacterized protein YbjT (DUF2867 family)